MVRAVAAGEVRGVECLGARRVERMLGCRLRSFGAEELEDRQRRHVLLAASGARQRHRAEQA